MITRDWYEFVALHRAQLVDAYLRAGLNLLARRQTPERRPPSVLPFDDSGWVIVPKDWERPELPFLDLRVLPRGQEHFTSAVFRNQLNDPHLGQAAFEQTLTRQVPDRLPTPFAGKVDFELVCDRKRMWHGGLPARVGWRWPPPVGGLR